MGVSDLPPLLWVLGVFYLKGAPGGSAEGVHRASLVLVLVLLRMQGLGNKEGLKLWKSF